MGRVALVATLAGRLGIEDLADGVVRLPRGAGAANAGRKVMALIFAMLLGADSIDDCDVLRAGRTRRLLGGWVPAPSTLGTFLRAFTFGHVRQLDALLDRSLQRAWAAGAGPGDGRLVVDVDSFVGEVCGYLKRGAGYGYTKRFGYHPILATRADTREALHIRLRRGSANTGICCAQHMPVYVALRTMLPSVECGRRSQGIEPAGATYFGRVEGSRRARAARLVAAADKLRDPAPQRDRARTA